MKRRYVLFLALALLCTTVDGFAQGKRTARKRSAAKKTVVKETQPEAEVKEAVAEKKEESKAVTLPAQGGAPVVVIQWWFQPLYLRTVWTPSIITRTGR